MKVLFAVSNENISESIVRKYQKEYKEIISYKYVYYFNAILKEIQKDKTYDRIVISEDLEPFANNNYEQINKFIFEKLDSISDEASDSAGNDTPIILICTDRRTKSEPILVKLFGIGIYSALIGQDRSINEVCKLIHKPRTKKEAKIYYKIDVDEVNYQSENENEVSEVEIQNIINHYKRLGKNEDRYVDSFNNIASQYTDAQLKIIAKYLPLNVKAVLEAESPKYQSIMSFESNSATTTSTYRPREIRNTKKQQPEEPGLQVGFIETTNKKTLLSRPVIVPSSVNSNKVKKLSSNKLKERIKDDEEDMEKLKKKKEAIAKKKKDNKEVDKKEIKETKTKEIEKTKKKLQETKKEKVATTKKQATSKKTEKEIEEPPKRKRGRPKKVVEEPKIEQKDIKKEEINEPPKRKRGRPKKVVEEPKIQPEEEILEEVNLYELEENEEETSKNQDIENNEYIDEDDEIATLPGFEDDEDGEYETYEEDYEDEDYEDEDYEDEDYEEDYKDDEFHYEHINKQEENSYNSINNYTNSNTREISNTKTQYNINQNLDNLFTKDKKVVSFVGTTKNGTSFIVNNLAELLSSTGIKTAILDVTKNKNSYYIYTRNEENLRKIAFSSIEKLRQGIAEGIKVNKNLDVYTTLPDEEKGIEDYSNILATLLENYSLILIDCDFNTPIEYFEKSQEIYLVQSMDVLTIQPLTAFLRELKANNVLEEQKIRVVINKEQRVKSLNPKIIIGGMAFYNDPAMSFMTELFNKDKVKHCIIPFEEQVYSMYLDALVNCNISIKGYSKTFMSSLKTLGNMVYPLINNKYNPPASNNYDKNNKFSANMNNTLEQMKKKY